MKTMRRVLSLDGGGVRGAFSASFLATLEASLDDPIGRHFDLIAGTSTGGIIGLGLASGMSAQEILQLYREMGRVVFKRRSFFGLTRSRYDNRALRETLTSAFGETTLASSRSRLVVPAYDVGSQCGVLMKTPHCSDYVRDGQRKLVDVALATAAAPTYFPIMEDHQGARLVDGGVFANNPAVVAVAEGVFKLGWPRQEIRLLSIGTTRGRATPPPRFSGRLGWWKQIFEVFSASQDWMAHGIVGLALGNDQVHRIDPVLERPAFGLDEVNAIPALIDLGRICAQQHAEELAEVFFAEPAIPWQQEHALATVGESDLMSGGKTAPAHPRSDSTTAARAGQRT